jgi:hypothetical protein
MASDSGIWSKCGEYYHNLKTKETLKDTNDGPCWQIVNGRLYHNNVCDCVRYYQGYPQAYTMEVILSSKINNTYTTCPKIHAQ